MTSTFDSASSRAVIVISSHVTRGTVGNRAKVFVLETLGFPVWAVPTILLPWHPGHGLATRIVPPAKDFAAFMSDLGRAPWLGEVAAVLSGYLGDPGQAEHVAALVARVKERNPAALYVCDPVLGDQEGVYVPQATAEAIRDRLMPIADLATPNRYELAWLEGAELNTTEAIIAAARRSGAGSVLVTSSPGNGPDRMANLLVASDHVLSVEHEAVKLPPKGTGDVTTAAYLGRYLETGDPARALQLATASIVEIVRKAAERSADELMLETDAGSLKRPALDIPVTRMNDM